MHDITELESKPEKESGGLPEGCGYRIGALVFLGLAGWLALSLLRGLAS